MPLISPPRPPGSPCLGQRRLKARMWENGWRSAVFPFSAAWERTLHRRTGGQVGPKQAPPPLPAVSLQGRPPPPVSLSLLFSGPWDGSLTWTLHLATMRAPGRLTIKWVQGGKGQRRDTRANARPGRTPHSPIPRTAPGVQAPGREFCAKPCFHCLHLGHGPAGLRKAGAGLQRLRRDPRSCCLRRRGAAHAFPAAAASPGARGPPGGRCPGSKGPPGPQALGAAPQQRPWDSETESRQEASSPLRSTPKRI